MKCAQRICCHKNLISVTAQNIIAACSIYITVFLPCCSISQPDLSWKRPARLININQTMLTFTMSKVHVLSVVVVSSSNIVVVIILIIIMIIIRSHFSDRFPLCSSCVVFSTRVIVWFVQPTWPSQSEPVVIIIIFINIILMRTIIIIK